MSVAVSSDRLVVTGLTFEVFVLPIARILCKGFRWVGTAGGSFLVTESLANNRAIIESNRESIEEAVMPFYINNGSVVLASAGTLTIFFGPPEADDGK